MADRKKVIKGLEETEIMLSQAVDRGGGMSVMGAFNCLNHVTDALALLKEQEAVKPILVKLYPHDVYKCGNCGHCAVGTTVPKTYRPKYCPECGRKVKWDADTRMAIRLPV